MPDLPIESEESFELHPIPIEPTDCETPFTETTPVETVSDEIAVCPPNADEPIPNEPATQEATPKRSVLRTILSICRILFYLCGGTAIIFGAVSYLTSQHLYLLAMGYQNNPFLLLLNILPIFMSILLLYFITRRLPFSISLVATVSVVLAIADNIKVAMRQEPLLPTDLSLVKEALAIFRTFPKEEVQTLVVLLGVCVLVLILTFIFSKKEPWLPWFARIALTLMTILAMYGVNQKWYLDKTIYDGFPTAENSYFQVNQYESRGFVYSFVHQMNIMFVSTPVGYSSHLYDKLEAEAATKEFEAKPHIIMIMGEAFSDLSENPNLDFSNHVDPMKNFKTLAESENAVSGHIVVPNFGGGTSNTEYDVLTACPTRYLENALPSYNFVNHDFDSIPQRLKSIGYETLSIHPGYAWFYNRQNVYPRLGFSESYFLEDSFDLEEQGIGGYVSDVVTTNKIIETFESHIATSDAPLFSFTVTIQNHGPYEKKYGPVPQNFDTDVALTAEESDLLTQYFAGVADGDKELLRLTDYAQESEEPIVVVYFGDHLPGFSNGKAFFDILDYPISSEGSLEERLALYETPFLIWENDAAKQLVDIQETAENASLPESGIIASHNLGALALELIGMNGLSPYIDFVNTLRIELPVAIKYIYVDNNGEYSATVPEAQAEAVAKLSGWQYYKLFDQSLTK